MIAHVPPGICYSFFIIRMTTSLLSGIRRHIVVAKNTVMSFRLYAILSHQVLVYMLIPCWTWAQLFWEILRHQMAYHHLYVVVSWLIVMYKQLIWRQYYWLLFIRSHADHEKYATINFETILITVSHSCAPLYCLLSLNRHHLSISVPYLLPWCWKSN